MCITACTPTCTFQRTTQTELEHPKAARRNSRDDIDVQHPRAASEILIEETKTATGWLEGGNCVGLVRVDYSKKKVFANLSTVVLVCC